MRKRNNRQKELCYITRKDEREEVFCVNLVNYEERVKIAKEKRERIEKKKKEEESKREKFFKYSIFGKVFYKPMRYIDTFRDFVLEENIEIPSMTV